MNFLPSISRRSKALVLQWHMMLAMASALARQILQMQRTQPRKALEKADMLEAWCWLALTEVSQQIDVQAEHGLPRRFDEQLPPIAIILQTLLLFVQRAKRGLQAGMTRVSFPISKTLRVVGEDRSVRASAILDPG